MSEVKTIWEKNFDVNPRFTKKVSVAGKPSFTNIDTYYLLEVATKQFGAYGSGFGISKAEWSEREFKDGTILMIINAIFFYYDDAGERQEFPIRNSLKYVYNTKQGYLKIDEDAPKKLMTNTISKALSYLGFGASIYMGMWEDFAYINEVSADFTMINNDQRVEISKLIQDTDTDLAKFNESFGIGKLTDLPISQYNKAIALLNSKLNKMKKQKNEDSNNSN
jgi:hypothetical protein